MERWVDAIKAYERFIGSTPDPFEAEEARDRIKKLRERLAAQAPAAPPATPEEMQAGKLIERGAALFTSGRVTEARALFQQAHKLVPEKANPWRWMGMSDARLGKCTAAVEELEGFLERVPPRDPRVAEAVTIRDRCREELGPTSGTLVIESTPTGAEVEITGAGEKARVAGRTPYRNDKLALGDHAVTIRKVGYAPLDKRFSIARRETVRLDVALQPAVEQRNPPPSAQNGNAKSRPASTQVAIAKSRPATTPPPVAQKPRAAPPPPPPPVRTAALERPRPAPRVVTERPVAEPTLEPNFDEPPPPRRPSLVAPIVVGAAALAVGAAGLGLALSVGPDFNNLQSTCAPGCAPDQWADLKTRVEIGYAVMGVGGALAIVDAVLWGLALRRPTEHAARLVPTLVPGGGGGLALGGSF
jgi:hypothetical protein